MKFWGIISILRLFLYVIEVNTISITVSNKQLDKLLYCASQLLNAQCENNTAIVYSQQDHLDEFVQEIKNAKVVVDVNKPLNNTTGFFKFPMYVVLINAVEEFGIFLKLYSMSMYWNPRARFVIIYSGKEEINVLFQMAWRQYIVNIIILTLNNAKVDIYTYFPYDNGKCGDDISKELLQPCKGHSFENMFPNKIPWTVNGCLIRVAVNHFIPYVLSTNLRTENASESGSEVVLIGTILRRLNFTMATIALDGKLFSSKNPDGSYTGPTQYLHNGTSDLLFGHLWYKFEFLPDIDITYPYLFDRNTWFVPAARPSQQWKSLYFIFEKSLWLSVSVIFLCNVIIWWMFGKQVPDFKHWKSISWCILCSWSALLLVSFRLPRANVLRLLVIFWVITGYLLATAYQSKLLSILTKPIYESQITTLEELLASKYKIVYFNALYYTPDMIISDTDRKIVKKGKSVTVETYLKILNNISNTGFLAHSVRIRYDSLKYHTFSDGTPKLYEFKTAVAIGPLSMQTTKGFPFLDHFDKLLLWLRQTGLINKWMQSIDQSNQRKKCQRSDAAVKLSLNHFLGAFYLLLFGTLFALFVFMLELFFGKKCKHT